MHTEERIHILIHVISTMTMIAVPTVVVVVVVVLLLLMLKEASLRTLV